MEKKSDKNITITYDTLFELLKRERDLADLQKLEPTFFGDFISYVEERKSILDKEDSIFSYDEKKKVEKQLDNARRIIKELYERREKKVLTFALMKSRTKANLIDMSPFLESDKQLFNEIMNILDSFRNKIANNLIVGLLPEEVHIHQTSKSQTQEQEQKKTMKLVRFLNAVPQFVGTELEQYGPFDEEDIAHLPNEIAELLISKGKVEEING